MTDTPNPHWPPKDFVLKEKEEEEYTIPPFRHESDLMMRQELGETIDWGLHAQGVPDFWKKSKGAGIQVAVIDTGASDHADLPEPAYVANFTNSDTHLDRQGHGTHVAGIIAARADGLGVIGVAPECELAMVKGLGDNGAGRMEQLAQAIDFCAERSDIINLSWGGGFPTTAIDAALARAAALGTICVAAAGNRGSRGMIHPATSDLTLAVGSYNQAGTISDFSSRGPKMDVAAPGEKITSTWLRGGYKTISGTSMAAPHICGLLALALSAGVEITAETVRDVVKSVADDRGRSGFDHSWGWGVVDLDRFQPSEPEEPETPEPEKARLGPYTVIWTPGGGLTIHHDCDVPPGPEGLRT